MASRGTKQSSNLSLNEAIDMAQNCPLWRLMSMFRVTHLSVGKRVGTPLIVSQQLHVATQITFGGKEWPVMQHADVILWREMRLNQWPLIEHNLHFWHASLAVHSTKHRHQSPEWTILSYVSCFIQGKVTGFQVLLGSLHLCGLQLSKGKAVNILASF